jgi:hypothetical protein
MKPILSLQWNNNLTQTFSEDRKTGDTSQNVLLNQGYVENKSRKGHCKKNTVAKFQTKHQQISRLL